MINLKDKVTYIGERFNTDFWRSKDLEVKQVMGHDVFKCEVYYKDGDKLDVLFYENELMKRGCETAGKLYEEFHYRNEPDTIPSHYKANEFDVIDFCNDYGLNFNRGNVVKYVARAGKKENELKDLKKALDYIQREIKFLENDR